MGNIESIPVVNYEDVQLFLKNPNHYILLNTFDINHQECLILNTLKAQDEEEKMNYYLNNNKSINIIIYGRNSNDSTTYNK